MVIKGHMDIMITKVMRFELWSCPKVGNIHMVEGRIQLNESIRSINPT